MKKILYYQNLQILILPFHKEMDEIREDLQVKLKLELLEEALDQLTKIK